MRNLLLFLSLASGAWACLGCSKDPSQTDTHEHHHEVASHMPTSLGDLCRKMRDRLQQINNGQTSVEVESELIDLVSWAPEFAADTDISESRWIAIYESSEQVRTSIGNESDQWNQSKIDEISQLCQLSEDAWMTLGADKRVERYQAHSHHDHDHGDHDHGDHSHGDHDHGDHDHGDHDHGDHDHGDHSHDDHSHDDHDHGTHQPSERTNQ